MRNYGLSLPFFYQGSGPAAQQPAAALEKEKEEPRPAAQTKSRSVQPEAQIPSQTLMRRHFRQQLQKAHFARYSPQIRTALISAIPHTRFLQRRASQFATPPQRECFETHNPRRGFVRIKFCTAPQREHCDTHDPHKPFTGDELKVCMVQKQKGFDMRRVRRTSRKAGKFAWRHSKSAKGRQRFKYFFTRPAGSQARHSAPCQPRARHSDRSPG